MKDIIPEVSRAWGIGLYSPPKYKFMIEKIQWQKLHNN